MLSRWDHTSADAAPGTGAMYCRIFSPLSMQLSAQQACKLLGHPDLLFYIIVLASTSKDSYMFRVTSCARESLHGQLRCAGKSSAENDDMYSGHWPQWGRCRVPQESTVTCTSQLALQSLYIRSINPQVL